MTCQVDAVSEYGWNKCDFCPTAPQWALLVMVVVTLTGTRPKGTANDGYADNLSLVLAGI
jgi:hypothetical protein